MADIFENLVYSKEDVIHFPEGIPGFESAKEFVLVKIPDHEPFEWLVCVPNTRLRFAVVNPLIINPGYAPPVSKEQLAQIKITNPDDVTLYVIVTLKEPISDSTVNFIGPVFINRSQMLGRQIVIDSDRFSVQERILRSA